MQSRLSLLTVAVLLAAVTSGAAAQGPGAERARMMNPLAIEGPPEPAQFATIVGLTAEQQPKYAALRKSYLADTKVQRDSVTALRGEMRLLMQGGNREAGRPQMEKMRGLGLAINERYEEFESELGFLLTEPQQEKFATWKEQERTRMREERRQRMAERRQ